MVSAEGIAVLGIEEIEAEFGTLLDLYLQNENILILSS